MIDQLTADGPCLFFGGVYSNLEAFRAVLAEGARLGVPPRRMICAGDVVAYGADAAACVDLARTSGVRVVAGNCEEALAARARDCGCGFAPGGACDALAAAWFAHAAAEIDDDRRAWMADLPKRLDLTINGLRLAVVHGAPDETNRFVFASGPDRVFAQDIEATGCDGVLAGHSGLPFTRVVGGRLWHNAGGAGMPANDGTPRVWFSLLTPGAAPRTLVVEHRALIYDHAAAAAKMRAARLPEGYADALATGLWPSCESLPKAEAEAMGRALPEGGLTFVAGQGTDARWPPREAPKPLARGKFRDPQITAAGERRAVVGLDRLATLWINTGTLCNLSCASCYIESTPRNDRLAYFKLDDALGYLDEIEREGLGTREIGFTGGEPFLNPDMIAMMEAALARGFRVLVLTNAMKPMRRHERALLDLNARYGERLTMRVSIDHYTARLHELERGARTFQPTIDGLEWLTRNGFRTHVAGRLYSGETEPIVRAGYAKLFAAHGVVVDAQDAIELTLFPEMDAQADTPEITEACWGILGKSPSDVMCASSRMAVRRKGASGPAVLACTLLAYDPQFELGATLAEAARPVALNHPHCARFCVLGGAACSKAAPQA
ncbi:MAG TPA: radical SAM protein [Beijerinckiaceae bacterium]|jgi:predicted phosphodiesterase/uncharacterized Fe-S cluster-containing radical SAM superfamily protein